MRTTIDITEEQHRALTALSARRSIRGFSPLVQEALDAYLAELGPDETDLLLSLEGSITAREARQIHERIDDQWRTWRAS